jgi:PKD repeat protein
VADPVGIAYVRWGFGDGQAQRSLGQAVIKHTYRHAGTYLVQAIVTDNHGNELRKTVSLAVGPHG